MSLGADMTADTRALLTDFGSLGTLTTRVQGTYDETTSSATTTDTATSVQMLLMNYRTADLANSLIQAGDRKAIICATDPTGNTVPAPAPMDKITFGGTVYQIQAIEPINPGGTVVAYKAQVRAYG